MAKATKSKSLTGSESAKASSEHAAGGKARQDGGQLHSAPVQSTPEGVEAHPHRTGHIRADRLLAGAAIFMSLLSLLIAYKHGLIMRDLVSANSWPVPQYTSSNTDSAGALKINVSVQNAGVGPAIVKRFTVMYGNEKYTNPFALLSDCCGYRVRSTDPVKFIPGEPLVGKIEGTIIRAGETVDYLTMDFAEETAEVWRKLDAARFQLRFEACYCSVLGECWTSDLIGVEPRRVRACPLPADNPRRKTG